jgi:hypothetical protein
MSVLNEILREGLGTILFPLPICPSSILLQTLRPSAFAVNNNGVDTFTWPRETQVYLCPKVIEGCYHVMHLQMRCCENQAVNGSAFGLSKILLE